MGSVWSTQPDQRGALSTVIPGRLGFTEFPLSTSSDGFTLPCEYQCTTRRHCLDFLTIRTRTNPITTMETFVSPSYLVYPFYCV